MTDNKKTQKISVKKIIIIKPRVTEKTALLSDKNVYTFQIAQDATKNEVSKEIERIYKVKPVKVNIAKTAAKTVFIRGKKGTKKAIKKAYVYLKKGDKISFV